MILKIIKLFYNNEVMIGPLLHIQKDNYFLDFE